MLVVSNAQRWADMTLQRAGLPVTPENENTLYKWARAEGGLNHNNPLNTTQNWPGASLWNPQGVKTYPSLDVAAAATAQTLTNGYYPDILSMFQNSVPTSQWSNAARAQVSKWGTNTSFLGGGHVAPPVAGSPLNGAASIKVTALNPAPTGNPLQDFLNNVRKGLSPATFGLIPPPSSSGGGSSSGGNSPDPLGIGAAVGGATNRLIAGAEVVLGVTLLAVAALILMAIIVKASGVQGKVQQALGGAVGGTPVGRTTRAASAATAKAPKPAAAAEPARRPITAGGREIQVTNPESRARLQRAGVAA